MVYENSTSEVYLWNGAQWINIVNGGNVDIGLMNDLEDISADGVIEGDVPPFFENVSFVAFATY